MVLMVVIVVIHVYGDERAFFEEFFFYDAFLLGVVFCAWEFAAGWDCWVVDEESVAVRCILLWLLLLYFGEGFFFGGFFGVAVIIIILLILLLLFLFLACFVQVSFDCYGYLFRELDVGRVYDFADFFGLDSYPGML